MSPSKRFLIDRSIDSEEEEESIQLKRRKPNNHTSHKSKKVTIII